MTSNSRVLFSETYRSWLTPSAWIPRFPPQMWLKTSDNLLENAERNILAGLWDKMEDKFITIQDNLRLRTVTFNKDARNTPLVMLHGMGSGIGLFVLNYESLARNRPVHAFDLIGFGRSSRPKFSQDCIEAEDQFVESIEQWRIKMGLEKIVLMGHSLGGFLGAAYALKYPDSIRHMILVDPWGFPQPPDFSDKQKFNLPWYIKGFAYLVRSFNPLAGLRVLGPWGPRAVQSLRPDLVKKFAHIFEDDTVPQYIYHCNAQVPSGEVAFHSLSEHLGWAKRPMVDRIGEIPAHVPITMVYGSRSWITSEVGWQIKYKRPNSYVDINVVKGAGHHVYLDKADEFNRIVSRICDIVDQEFDLVTHSPIGAYRRLRRFGESADSPQGMGKLRRRTQSECPPDKMDTGIGMLRTNQTFAGLGELILEEASATSIQAEGESDMEGKSTVTFSLDPDTNT